MGSVVAPGAPCALVIRVGKPDPSQQVDRQVVGDVEPLALESVGQHGGATVLLVPHYTACAALARVQPALGVEHQAIGVVGTGLELGGRPTSGVVPQDPAGRDVGEQQAAAVPGRPLGGAAVGTANQCEFPAHSSLPLQDLFELAGFLIDVPTHRLDGLKLLTKAVVHGASVAAV